LCRAHRIDVLGSQIKKGLSDLFGQCEQRLGIRHRCANHHHLELGSPAMRDRNRGFAIVFAVPFTVLAASPAFAYEWRLRPTLDGA
jgi:hypothetical protein